MITNKEHYRTDAIHKKLNKLDVKDININKTENKKQG
jgi:hypothetical protein